MAERTLREEYRARLESGSTEEALKKKLKSQGMSSVDYDLPLSVARQKGLDRLSANIRAAGLQTPEELLRLETPKPTPVAAEEPVGLAEPVAPTVARTGAEGAVVSRVGGILQPLDTAKMVGGAISGFLGKPGAQAAREGAKEAVRTTESAKQSTLQNLERKRRRQKEMGLTDTEAFVVDAAEDAYELGTGLASILGTGLAGVPVPAGMENEMQPFKMGEDVGKQIIPGILGGIAATIEDPAVAGRAPLTTLLNVYPAARALTKFGTVAGIPAEAQLAIPRLVAQSEGYLANKFGNAWRLFINAAETGSPEANVLWKKLKESATTIDAAFNETLPKVESAILGERRLGIGPRKAPTGGTEAFIARGGITPGETPIPGPRFGKAELLTAQKTEKPTTLIPFPGDTTPKIAPTTISQEAKEFINSGQIFYAQDPIPLVHRSPSPIAISDIDVEAARVNKQSKGGRLETAGFYAYEPDANIISQRGVAEIERLDNAFGKEKFEFEIPAGTKILDLSNQPGSTARLDPQLLKDLRNSGYQVIKGKDVLGPPEYVVIDNKLFRPTPQQIPQGRGIVTLPAETVAKIDPAFVQLENQLVDAAQGLAENVRRTYRVDLGRVATTDEIRNLTRNATVDALREGNIAAIINSEELLKEAAKATRDSVEPMTWTTLEKKLRQNPFSLTTEQETAIINRLDNEIPEWRKTIQTPEFRNAVARSAIERTQNGIKKAIHEGLLENEAAPFMTEVDMMTETYDASEAPLQRKQRYTNLLNSDDKYRDAALQVLRSKVENNQSLPAFIPSTRSAELLEDLKGMLDISKPVDKKLMGYLESMASTPYTYSPSAQGLIAAPLVADAMASSANDLLAGTQYLLSTLPKRTALPLNLKSAYNNFVGNETVMAMAYGNMPGTTIPVAIAKELITSKPGSSMFKFKEAGKRVGLFDTDVLAKDIENFTRLQEGLLAKGQRGIEKVLGPTTKAFGSLSAGADKLYKTYTGYKEFNRGLEYIDELGNGQYVQFATGQNTAQRITRKGDDLLYLQNYSLGKEVGKPIAIGFDSANLSNEGYNALARYAKTVADSYFFDYGEVPRLLQMIRKAPVVGVGTPFFTWSYKAVDLPWKQGLAMATIRGPDRIVSNSKLVNLRQGKDAALIALRRAGLTALAKREMETDPELNRVMSYNPKEPGSKIFKSLGDPGIYAEMNLGQADPFGNTLNAATIVSNVASDLYERIAGTSTDAQLEAIIKNPNAATEEQFTALAAKLRRDSIYKKETLPLVLNLFGLGMTFFSEKYVDLLKAQEQGNSTDFAKLALDLYVPGMAKTAYAYMNDELVEGLMRGAVPGSPIAESTAQYAVRNFLGPGYATVNTPQQYKRFRDGVIKEMEAVVGKKQKQIAIKRKEKADSADLDKEEEALDLMKDIIEQAIEEMDSYWEKAVPVQED